MRHIKYRSYNSKYKGYVALPLEYQHNVYHLHFNYLSNIDYHDYFPPWTIFIFITVLYLCIGCEKLYRGDHILKIFLTSHFAWFNGLIIISNQYNCLNGLM